MVAGLSLASKYAALTVAALLGITPQTAWRDYVQPRLAAGLVREPDLRREIRVLEEAAFPAGP